MSKNRSVYNRAYYQRNRAKILAKQGSQPARDRANTRRLKAKLEIVALYGGKCACQPCGESNWKFLTLDHINGGGSALRKTTHNDLWKWVATHGYSGQLRLMCWNCNMGRAMNGGQCPHSER